MAICRIRLFKLRGPRMGYKNLLMRLEALETQDKAPSYLVELLKEEMAQAGINDELPPNMTTGECLAKLIELKPD